MPTPSSLSPALVWEVIDRLDHLERPVTDWEANFLESVLAKRDRFPTLTAKQLAIVVRMAEQYLDATTAAELRGQQRLFA
jgi:hypothetical protein